MFSAPSGGQTSSRFDTEIASTEREWRDADDAGCTGSVDTVGVREDRDRIHERCCGR